MESIIHDIDDINNYVTVALKLSIVVALGSAASEDFPELWRTHSCLMPCSLGVKSYADIKKQHF